MGDVMVKYICLNCNAESECIIEDMECLPEVHCDNCGSWDVHMLDTESI